MIAVTFKHETLVGGEAAGPVYVIDVAAMQADPNMRGFMPYGYEPEWREDKGWLTMSQAEAVAREHGVELEVR